MTYCLPVCLSMYFCVADIIVSRCLSGCPPAKQETQVQSLGRENPLQKEMATHSSILAGEIPWTEGASRTIAMGVAKESDTT